MNILNQIHNRYELLEKLTEGVVPRLWCPPLTHYTDDGSIDKRRIAVHWAWMRRNIRAFLIPGSTGDGWEMNDEEVSETVNYALELASELDVSLLIGVLKTDVSSMLRVISETMQFLLKKTATSDPFKALKQSKVIGFTVCPAHGSSLSKEQIEKDLESILLTGYPIALYQLPQMTENEMTPEVIERLAKRYKNFILLKDSSGNDRLALYDQGKSGVFMVRGAEGDYSEWLCETGGPYNGLLLSTANCFSEELIAIINFLEKGDIQKGKELSTKLTKVVRQVFSAVSDISGGNPFANANKAIDHYFAYGQKADQISSPMLHCGMRMPDSVMSVVRKILINNEMMPSKGYLDETI